MRVAAIVSEYNPFHKGHKYQIEETKKIHNIDYVIAVMSGHFVQRGEPALLDKWSRAKLAMAGGIDLVLELPTPLATASAELFAMGSIDLINKLGIVDVLSFGSESGDLTEIDKLAEFLVEESISYKMYLKEHLKKGHSYPKARTLALEATYTGDASFLKGSNNILAIEYLKSLKRLKSTIKPITIKRVGASYLSETINTVLPSATAIRKALKDNQDLTTIKDALPPEVYNCLCTLTDNQFSPLHAHSIYPYYELLFKSLPSKVLDEIYDLPADLSKRIINNILKSDNYDALIDSITAKNYTKTTVQRGLLHAYLHLTKTEQNTLQYHNLNQYIRVLGFKKSASPLLQRIKLRSELPLITNIKDHQNNTTPLGKSMLLNEIKYTNLYNQLLPISHPYKKKNDYNIPIIIL